MTKEESVELVRSLTGRQAKILKGLTHMGGGRLNSLATGLGQESGAIAYSLEQKGLIEQVGRTGPYKRYAVTPQWQSSWDAFREDIQRILDTNIRMEDMENPVKNK